MIATPINPANIELLRVVKAECQICFTVEYTEASAISEGQEALNAEGWRTIEIHGTINDPVCPHCIKQLKEEENEK